MTLFPRIAAAFLSALLLAAGARASDERTTAHGAHIHGEWTLFAALDGNRLTIALTGPLLDALGFERAPRGDAEKARAEAVSLILRDSANIIDLPAPSGCEITSSSVAYPWSANGYAGEPLEHDHAEEHDHHAMNVEAEYVFDCAEPGRLSELRARLFSALPSVKKLRAVYISETAQAEKALTEKSPVMRLN